MALIKDTSVEEVKAAADIVAVVSGRTQLRKAGMSLEAVQAQAGHASIESTRIYLHLGDDWLASQYRRAAEAIDAQALAVTALPGAR